MIKDYFKLAYESTKHRRVRSWLTMIGIFVGIAAVVALISLSQGLQDAVSEQFVNLGSDKIIISAAGSNLGPPGTAVTVPLTKEDKRVINKVKGIDLAVGRLLRLVKIEFKDDIKYDYVITIPEDTEEMALAIEANNYEIESGRMLKKGDLFKIMVGKSFAEDFNKKRDIELRDKIKIQDYDFEVVGILEKTGNPQSDGYIIIPEEGLRRILDVEDEYDIIPAKISSGEDIDIVSENVKKELRKLRNVEEGKEDFTIQTPEQILDILNNILAIVQGVLVGIAAISLVVGGIGIMNTMYTAVTERTKEIGIMKATGARNNQVLFLFIIESGWLGLLGGFIGIVLGTVISKSVELIAFQIYGSYLIKANFDPILLISVLLFAFLVGSMSGALPARQASKLKPVDALRKQ